MWSHVIRVSGVSEDMIVYGVMSLPVSGVFEDVTCVWNHVTFCQCLKCFRM